MVKLQIIKGITAGSMEGEPLEIISELTVGCMSVINSVSKKSGIPVELLKEMITEGLDFCDK